MADDWMAGYLADGTPPAATERDAYLRGFGEALAVGALAGADEAERRYGDGREMGFWEGLVEGLNLKPPVWRRRDGRGFGRGRPHRSLVRPPARMAVTR